MDSRARLIATEVPDAPAAVVLVLHGGAGRGPAAAVSPAQLSVLRMVPVARRIARAGKGRLAVWRLLNSTRGWDTGHTPVDDALWAIGETARQLGRDLPVCLVGHSLGGRAAILASGADQVVSAVALAPWVYPQDLPPGGAPGRRILLVHGTGDRIATPERSLAVARALGRTAEVGWVSVSGGKHAMLRHGRTFERLAAEWAAVTLLGDEPRGAVAEVLGGRSELAL